MKVILHSPDILIATRASLNKDIGTLSYLDKLTPQKSEKMRKKRIRSWLFLTADEPGVLYTF